MKLGLTLLGVLLLLGRWSAQTTGNQIDPNVPLSIQSDPAVSARYADALRNHPELLGGKYKDSPTFVGGQAYTYNHRVKLARWVLDNERARPRAPHKGFVEKLEAQLGTGCRRPSIIFEKHPATPVPTPKY